MFREQFGEETFIIEAPGRINLIGEHTDYNEGFVLPAAINKSVTLIVQKSISDQCTLIAKDLEEEFFFSLNEPLQPVAEQWVNYFLGVIAELQNKGCAVGGFNLMFAGDIPIGSGLSSSAAIACGFGYTLNELFDLGLSRMELAHIAQMAEHKFAGVACGIMDQMASLLGKKNHLLKLDCRSLNYEYIPANFGDYDLVLFDTNVKHSLADSEYNKRREQCAAGVEAVRVNHPDVSTLRDVSMENLDEVKQLLSKKVYNRCKYIIEENLRVNEACIALDFKNFEKLGELMFATHKGLSELYEVSCMELDFLVDQVINKNAVIGSRMMGGGFGGCTINLIECSAVTKVIDEMKIKYFKQTGIELSIYQVSIADGVHVK